MIQNVSSMDHNLVPPFMMRETGVIVKDTSKIQVEDPTEEEHAISFPETRYRILLSLLGVFSCFTTSKPTLDNLEDPVSIYLHLLSGTQNPNSDGMSGANTGTALANFPFLERFWVGCWVQRKEKAMKWRNGY